MMARLVIIRHYGMKAKQAIIFLLFWLGYQLIAYAELNGQACLQLDNPSVVSDYPYANWRCQDITIPEIENTVFHIRLRWNRPNQANTATVVWLGGGDGSLAHADFDHGVIGADDTRSLRQHLDEDFAIRSIELQFLNPPDDSSLGGYWAAPRVGYLKPARGVMAALDYLMTTEVVLLQGQWLTAVGSSNGSAIWSFALAYLGADQILDRVVMISGPFLGAPLRECQDPDFIAYIGQNDIQNDGLVNRIPSAQLRTMISSYNGWSDCREAGLSEVQRSALGVGAQRHFPTTDISVFIGAREEFSPWLENSNRYWYGAITARNKAYTLLENGIHNLWSVDVTIHDLLTQGIAQPPERISEGLFTLASSAIHYSNGGQYCYFSTMATYTQLTGRSDIQNVIDYQSIPRAMQYAGLCKISNEPQGIFTLALRDVFYAEGGHYCYFPTMLVYTQLTGRSDILGVPDFAELPTHLAYDGYCN